MRDCVQHRAWLHKRVAIGYTFDMSKKDVGLRIRVSRELRDEFLAVCRVQDKPASQVLRDFMRDYIEALRQAEQQTLFDAEEAAGVGPWQQKR